MDTYRIRFTLAAPSATPWQADTLWGHLCWALLRRHGEAALRDFLDAYRAGAPPLILSDGFPADTLPRPLLPPPPVAAGGKRAGILAARAGKAASGTLLSLDAFQRLRHGRSAIAEDMPTAGVRRILALRNQINRLTSTTGGEDTGGRLYAVEEYHAAAIDVYARLTPEAADLLWLLLDDLAIEGYGKRRAVGYGAIAAWERRPFDGFQPIPEANAFLTLSRFVPAANDPSAGMWRTTVKVGTVGGETATPFKRPLVMLTAGSWFHADQGIRDWYGRIVEDISPAHPHVVQYGLAFAVPMRAPEQAEA